MRNRKAALDNVCRITQRQISTRGRPVRHRERRLQFTAVSPAVRINYLPADASSSICVNACSKRRRAHPVERVCQLLTVFINQWRSLLSQSGPSVATSMDESWFPFNSAELTSQPPPRLSPTSLTSEKLRHTIIFTLSRGPRLPGPLNRIRLFLGESWVSATNPWIRPEGRLHAGVVPPRLCLI